MKTRLTLKAGDKGTGKLTAQYGDRLVCVRYRYDEKRKKRFKTIELIVEEKDWHPRVRKDARGAGEKDGMIVGLRVGIGEKALRQRVKEAGAWWDGSRKLWIVRHSKISGMGLDERIAKVISK